MRALILHIILTLMGFVAIFAVLGGRFGPLEATLWLALQVAVIIALILRYRKRTAKATNNQDRTPA
ncbi:hypothetical protein [Streptomyces sp. NPDC058718]|uniref:hypothetical protein n=1 Tax=Streptomyces sp. NPDC058718 TaxID=3346610 RepID=UPI0036AC6B43